MKLWSFNYWSIIVLFLGVNQADQSVRSSRHFWIFRAVMMNGFIGD